MLGREISSLPIKIGYMEAPLIAPTIEWDQGSRTLVQLRLAPSLLIEGVYYAC